MPVQDQLMFWDLIALTNHQIYQLFEVALASFKMIWIEVTTLEGGKI